MEGYNPILFLSEINSDFLCHMCNLVVRKPRECIVCGNIFCENCIKNWAKKLNKISYVYLSPNKANINTNVNNSYNTLNNNSFNMLSNNPSQDNSIIITECPLNCKTNCNLKESIMKPVGKVVKNLLCQLKIKCPNNKCEKVMTLDKYDDHENYCFLPKCDNKFCGVGSDKLIPVS